MAVFKSVEQALFVAFLFEVLPASPRSPTAIVIDALVEHYDAWGIEPPAHDRVIDFEGLSPLEVRAQCALVLGIVKNFLPEHERDAVLVRYSRSTAEGEKRTSARLDGKLDEIGKRWGAKPNPLTEPFTKPGAVNRLARYCALDAMIEPEPPWHLLSIGWSLWGTRTQRRDLTAQAIAVEFKCSERTVKNQRKRMRERGEWLFARAVERIEPMMRDTGLVETPYVAQCA